ncbi:MAG TPA: hypothetical protein VGK32_03405 [Vicinamibacterales bacterium]|jgi:anti-sigma factor RsiW
MQRPLNGWKDIAEYLAKCVRTVQRWEKEYGLPVRRIGRAGGEIVFAFPAELDAWRAAQSARMTPAKADSAGPRDRGVNRRAGASRAAERFPWRLGTLLAALAGFVVLAAGAMIPDWRVLAHPLSELLKARRWPH